MSEYGSCSPRDKNPQRGSRQSFLEGRAEGVSPLVRSSIEVPSIRWRTPLVRPLHTSSLTNATANTLPSNHGDSQPANPQPSVSSDTADSPTPHAHTSRSAELASNGIRIARNSNPPTAQLPNQIAAATANRSSRCERFDQLAAGAFGGVTTFDHKVSGKSNQRSTRLTGGLLFGNVK